ARGAAAAVPLAARDITVHELSAILGRASIPARAAAIAPDRPEDLPGRTADEAGPDEHGDFDRKPRTVPRSRIRRVLHARARAYEAAQRGRQVHREEGDREHGAARNHLSQEDGLPHAVAPVAYGRALAPSARPAAREGRPARRVHRSQRARSIAGAAGVGP